MKPQEKGWGKLEVNYFAQVSQPEEKQLVSHGEGHLVKEKNLLGEILDKVRVGEKKGKKERRKEGRKKGRKERKKERKKGRKEKGKKERGKKEGKKEGKK